MRKSLIFPVILLLSAGPVLAGWDEGVVAFNKGDYQTAAQEFQQVVEQNPDAPQGHSMLGRSLTRLKRKDEALNHFRKAYDLNPNDLSIKIELGQGYYSVRRYAEAAKLLSTVSASEIGGLNSKTQAFLYQIRAVAREKSNDSGGAFQDYKALSRLKPGDAQIQLKYGVLASNNNQMSEALSALDRAAQADPRNQDVLRTQVTILKKKGRMDRDKNSKKQTYLKAANIAAKLASASGSYDNYLLQCEVELGATLYDKAVSSCKSAADKKASDWLAKFYLGQAYTSTKQFDVAAAPLKEAVSLASSRDDQNKVWKQLGFVYEKQKNYSASIEAYEKAGDKSGVARVQENEKTARENADIERQNQEIEQMRKEAEALEKQLQELEEGGGGR